MKKVGLHTLYKQDPLNAETPAHLLDDAVTPARHHFIRNNGLIPEREVLNPAKWSLTIDGESVKRSAQFSIAELKQRFTGSVFFPKAGYYEVWARATDSTGRSQPALLPGWNPRGYLNNPCHRIAVRVA